MEVKVEYGDAQNFLPRGFEAIEDPKLLEEEHLDEFKGSRYYPVYIGDVFASTYQTIGKLGFGNTFDGVGGDHYCLVQQPIERFTDELLKVRLKHLYVALDYLHYERKLVHTGKPTDNVLQSIKDPSLLETFLKANLTLILHPENSLGTPRFMLRGRPRYPRRFGQPVLSDFGAAVRGDVQRNHDALPAVHQPPEIILKVDWSYPVEITLVSWVRGMLQRRPEDGKTARQLLQDP
ncbi:kinase domain protein [Xylaria sp. CBS 124048]|nr:kinase domain protein [Xylaria sp. CBS 124048]